METLRDAYARATGPAQQKRIAEEVQIYNTRVVTHIPLGEWFGLSAVRRNIELPARPPPVTVFWGIDRKE
jgi:peptide/nickel transport system substrate-binding protein